MAKDPKDEEELKTFLEGRLQGAQEYRPKLLQPKSTGTLQHNLARNLLLGFLFLIIVILWAVYLYDARFCSGASGIQRCGTNFINMSSVIDTLLNFGTPFIGILLGFFFSEKFKAGRDDE